MTWASRHELNVGCLKARGEYNCLGGDRTGPWVSCGQQWWCMGRIQHG